MVEVRGPICMFSELDKASDSQSVNLQAGLCNLLYQENGGLPANP